MLLLLALRYAYYHVRLDRNALRDDEEYKLNGDDGAMIFFLSCRAPQSGLKWPAER